MHDIAEKALIKNGKMGKSPLDMTSAERNAWYRLIQENAREYLFSIGQPLVYKKDGAMIAEYADGRIENIA